eukprot:jgi/Chrzof1/12187/Cz06g24130.t1
MCQCLIAGNLAVQCRRMSDVCLHVQHRNTAFHLQLYHRGLHWLHEQFVKTPRSSAADPTATNCITGTNT